MNVTEIAAGDRGKRWAGEGDAGHRDENQDTPGGENFGMQQQVLFASPSAPCPVSREGSSSEGRTRSSPATVERGGGRVVHETPKDWRGIPSLTEARSDMGGGISPGPPPTPTPGRDSHKTVADFNRNGDGVGNGAAVGHMHASAGGDWEVGAWLGQIGMERC